MTSTKQPEILKNLTLFSAHIRDKHHFAFVGQRVLSDDSWQHTPTFIIFYFGKKSGDERWKTYELEMDTWVGELQGTWCDKPEGLWLFGYRSNAEFLVFNEKGERIDKEVIPKRQYKEKTLTPSVEGIKNVCGYIYTVSGVRTVWQRVNRQQWELLDQGIPKLDYYDRESKDRKLLFDHGFSVIDGFDKNDVYACGGDADLWHFNGKIWNQKELPTNAFLKSICCGSDGKVYILTNRGTVIVGRDNRWRVIEQELTQITLEKVTWYRDRCYINTGGLLYEITNGEFIQSPLQKGMPTSPAHIDARGDIFLATALAQNGENNVAYYDGEQWHAVITPDLPPRDPNQPTPRERLKALQERRAKEEREHQAKYGEQE